MSAWVRPSLGWGCPLVATAGRDVTCRSGHILPPVTSVLLGGGACWLATVHGLRPALCSSAGAEEWI